jgi:hypothetical protein
VYPFALEGSIISKTTDMSVFVKDSKVADESSGWVVEAGFKRLG